MKQVIIGAVRYVGVPNNSNGCGDGSGRRCAGDKNANICSDLGACPAVIFLDEAELTSTDKREIVETSRKESTLSEQFDELQGAKDTLIALGYTYRGGQRWQRADCRTADALARDSDPITSKQAAEVMQRKAGKIADLILIELQNGNFTGSELVTRTGVPLNSITPRFAQLSRRGLIHAASGKGRETVWAIGNGVQA